MSGLRLDAENQHGDLTSARAPAMREERDAHPERPGIEFERRNSKFDTGPDSSRCDSGSHVEAEP